MKIDRLVGFVSPVAICVGVLVVAMVGSSKHVSANDDEEHGEDARIKQGLEIAPVPLKLEGKDLKAVGLGSYLVNATSECNGCHSAGTMTQYLNGGNPFFGQPAKPNPATYLGGGRNFLKLEGPNSPDIISRNLTPDKTGRPAGGHTFEEFLAIMRRGKDFDHLHPQCSASVTTNCLTPPFDAELLQIMPWAAFRSMTDHDLWAIYQYLSAVPCIEGPEDPSSPLHNDCQ